MKRKFPSRGFTLFEMIVNLALLSGLLVSIGTLVLRTSDTVKDSTGKLAAAEKSESIRRILSADLAAIPADSEEALACSGNEASWSLGLRVPAREGGWKEIRYHWTKEEGNVVREVKDSSGKTSRVIGTGFSAVDSRWLKEAATDREKAPVSWRRDTLPGLLDLELSTTRVREEGKRDKVEEAHVASSSFRFLLPVGGGPAEQ